MLFHNSPSSYIQYNYFSQLGNQISLFLLFKRLGFDERRVNSLKSVVPFSCFYHNTMIYRMNSWDFEIFCALNTKTDFLISTLSTCTLIHQYDRTCGFQTLIRNSNYGLVDVLVTAGIVLR